KYAPYGLLPWYETEMQGLRLDKDGGEWIRMPQVQPSDARTDRRAELTLSDDGTLEGKVTVTFGGLEAMEYRTEARDDDDASRRTLLENVLKEEIPTGIDVELTNQPDWTSASP